MEEDMISDSWKKVDRECEKIGYRDGAETASQKVYQKYFDIGYEFGFKTAYNLRKTAGDSGTCILCSKPDVSKETIVEIQQRQSDEHKTIAK